MPDFSCDFTSFLRQAFYASLWRPLSAPPNSKSSTVFVPEPSPVEPPQPIITSHALVSGARLRQLILGTRLRWPARRLRQATLIRVKALLAVPTTTTKNHRPLIGSGLWFCYRDHQRRASPKRVLSHSFTGGRPLFSLPSADNSYGLRPANIYARTPRRGTAQPCHEAAPGVSSALTAPGKRPSRR